MKGLIGTGRKDLVYSTIDLIYKVSEKANGNGRLIHEVSTNGAVYNLGNVCEIPQTGVADKEKAIQALNTAQKYANPYGMIATGIDRDENAGDDESSYAATVSKDEFTYSGTVMTLPTGVQIIAENNYGRPDEAYKFLKMLAKHLVMLCQDLCMKFHQIMGL